MPSVRCLSELVGKLSVLLVLFVGCGGDWRPADDAGLICTGDLHCDDGIFCNGEERCAPHTLGADLLGCVEGSRMCRDGFCDERAEVCVFVCSTDVDGDGVRARRCGGTDCDDQDARRAPGATEVCDLEGRDEDCNPTTFGMRDDDGDGWPSAGCCNGVHCGGDCNDVDARVNPNADEACNTVDDDCDGAIDEDCVESPGSRRLR